MFNTEINTRGQRFKPGSDVPRVTIINTAHQYFFFSVTFDPPQAMNNVGVIVYKIFGQR